ncbi:MAG: choice-of-anchor D domain-containing protein, partial [Saprospiraceae bacterium]
CTATGSATMTGNAPTTGTGTWSQVSGPVSATITTPGSPGTTITGMTTAGTYIFKWTIANPPCTASEDQMSVVANAPPTAANAGPDASPCGLTTALAGNTPGTGTGTWTKESGPGTANFVNANSPTTSVTVSVAGAYTFRWTIANAPCSASTNDVVITFTPGPTTANAGPDQTSLATCGLTQVTLAGNTPSFGTGIWSIQSGSGGSFADANDPGTTFSGTAGSTYTLIWTISNAPCSASTDAMVVTFNQNPSFSNCPGTTTVNATSGCSAAATYAAATANTTPATTVAYSFSGATTGNGSGTGSGSTFNLGTTTVVLTATNSCGTSSCSFSVVVQTGEINVQGNATDIADGDNTPSAGDDTDFGQTNGPNVVRTFTVQNTGAAPLTVTNITLGGADPGQFSLGPLTPASPIPAGQSATVAVTYAPTAAAAHTATVNIASGDCDEAAYDFAVSGELTCTAPAFTACPSSVSVNTGTGTCSATAAYTATANGLPTPTLTYIFSGATTGSGSGTGSGEAFQKGVTTVTVTATNPCGAPVCSFTVTVTDDQLPTIACPAAVTVSCSTDMPAVNLTAVSASDNCGVPAKSHDGDATTGMTCANRKTVTRTYRATDGSGNSSTCAQVITVFDDVKPSFISVPANVTVQCNSVPAVGTATASDGCNGSVSVAYNGQTSAPGSCPDASTITRQWTATDGCGNTKTATQRITVIDTQKPNFTGTPANVTVQCNAVPAPATPTATDNCDASVAITYVGQTTTAGTCPNAYSLTRTWTAADNCGNTRTVTQRITVVDNIKPVFTSLPANASISCTETPPAVGNPTASDGCGGSVTVTYLGQTSASGTCPGSYQLRRTWRATDACGNSTAATQTIQVSDSGVPVFTSVPGPLTIECTDPIPPLVNPTATDACVGYVHIIFLGNVASGSGCSADYTITRTWRADDLCGNTTTTSQVITVQGTSYGEEETENRATKDKQLIALHSSFIVNPNPTSDRVWVDLSAFADQAVRVSVFDDLGRLVLERRIPVVEELKFSVSLREAGAAAGGYILSVRGASGVAATRVVLVE